MTKTEDLVIEYDHKQIEWNAQIRFPNTRTFRQYSHRIFNRYPARSISLVPRAIIRSAVAERRGSCRVLDPFMGSGTTAVEAALVGCDIFGVELDPFARLIANVRIRRYSPSDLLRLAELSRAIAREWERTVPKIELTPRLANVRHWFTDSQFDDLLRFKSCMYQLTSDDPLCYDFFRIVLADMIRPCSQAERQTLKPYISKKYKKIATSVKDAFKKSFEAHFDALREFNDESHSSHSLEIIWLGSDAADFSANRIKMDLAITSPPYTNALDYVRCIKIESAWVDCGTDESFANLRHSHIGDPSCRTNAPHDDVVRITRKIVSQINKVDPARAKTVLSYFSSMYSNLRCVWNCLRKGGEYHLIIGDSVIREVPVNTHEILADLGQHLGFQWTHYYKYQIRDHRLSIPRKSEGGKIDYEFVVSLRKP